MNCNEVLNVDKKMHEQILNLYKQLSMLSRPLG